MTGGCDTLLISLPAIPSMVGRAGLPGEVEVLAATVDPSAGDGSSALPDLDCLIRDAELGRHLLRRQHADGQEPVAQAGDAPEPTQLRERWHVEGLAPSARQTPFVEDLHRFAIGVVGEQLVDDRDRVGRGGVSLPGRQWPGHAECMGGAAREADVRGDVLIPPDEGDVGDEEADESFALAHRGVGVVPQSG